MDAMNKTELILIALASGPNTKYSPVQLQKLLFLIDRNVGHQLGGPFFNFRPYDYGPFDPDVYTEFSLLSMAGFGEIEGQGKDRRYLLNDAGRQRGEAALGALPQDFQRYFRECTQFVHSHSFSSLVASIYRHYPEMKVNSVFRG
jgi:hypothetical protein